MVPMRPSGTSAPANSSRAAPWTPRTERCPAIGHPFGGAPSANALRTRVLRTRGGAAQREASGGSSPKREPGHGAGSRFGARPNYSAPSGKHASSLSLRTNTHLFANAGCVHSTFRPNAAPVGSSNLVRLNSS